MFMYIVSGSKKNVQNIERVFVTIKKPAEYFSSEFRNLKG